MNSTRTGHKAEEAAKVYLEMRGYKVVEQNYRRSRCEIDIVAQKGDIMHFVEVKYRKHDGQGSGLEYVTATKLKQMQFAADTWVDEYKWHGDYQLSAIEIAGTDFVVLSFIENVL
ncbi:MAG TPA: YraN family protein [Candidatus Saccharimonadales bacterium]|nr:YraN family protein [Candidatus Saccharimonadales bacterium]